MDAIVFIDAVTTGSSRDAVKAANDMGYLTVVFTNRRKLWNERRSSPDIDLLIPTNINHLDKIENIIRSLISDGLEVKAVVSFVDTYCQAACELSKRLGLSGFTLPAVAKMQDKLLSRKTLEGTDFLPRYVTLSRNFHGLAPMIPCVLKETRSNGSKGVFLVTNEDEFRRFREYLLYKSTTQEILAEEYLRGPQYIVEALVKNGEVKIAAVIAQEIHLYNHHFIVTGYSLLTEYDQDFYDRLSLATKEIIKRHGYENGGCHLEMRYVNGNWKLVEINPRISGGAMNSLLETGLGINLVKETLKVALGQETDLTPKIIQPASVQYLTVDQAGTFTLAEGVKEAEASEGVVKVYIEPSPGDFIHPPLSLSHRYAYVLATGTNDEDAVRNAKTALGKIKLKTI